MDLIISYDYSLSIEEYLGYYPISNFIVFSLEEKSIIYYETDNETVADINYFNKRYKILNVYHTEYFPFKDDHSVYMDDDKQVLKYYNDIYTFNKSYPYNFESRKGKLLFMSYFLT